MAERTCSKEGCDRKHLARGLCDKHYGQYHHVHKEAMRAERLARSVCAVEGCNAPHRARGYCGKHYRRVLGRRPLTDPEVRLVECVVDGCSARSTPTGLCKSHRRLLSLYGDPLARKRGRGLEHGTVAGYKHFGCRCDLCREARRESELQWRAKNREAARRMVAKQAAKDPQRMAAYRRKWKQQNPEKVYAVSAASSALRASAPYDEQAVEYAAMISKDPCVYCGEPSAEIDHIVPIRDGGASEWGNLAPTCAACNRSKGAKSLLEYLRYRQQKAAG